MLEAGETVIPRKKLNKLGYNQPGVVTGHSANLGNWMYTVRWLGTNESILVALDDVERYFDPTFKLRRLLYDQV